MRKTSFVKWWLTTCVIVASSIFLYLMDAFHWVWDHDQTKISFAILSIFYAATLYIGYQLYLGAKQKKNKLRDMEYVWFIAASLTALGLIGTVTGFMTMLGDSFSQLDIEQIETTKEVIKEMALGMSTALITTLFGLACNLLLQFQLMNIRNAN